MKPGNSPFEDSISIGNRIPEIDSAVAWLESLGEMHNFPIKLTYNLELVLEEIVTNIIKYGYDDEDDHQIAIWIRISSSEVELEIADDGHEFNPLGADPPEELTSLEDAKIGGLGLYMVKKIMKDVQYQREGNHNRLRLLCDLA